MGLLSRQQTTSPEWQANIGLPSVKRTIYSVGNPQPYKNSLGYIEDSTRSPNLAAQLGEQTTRVYGLGKQGYDALNATGKTALVGAGALGLGLAGKAIYDNVNSDYSLAKTRYVYFGLP